MDFLEFTKNYFEGDTDKALAQIAKEVYTREYALSESEDNAKAILDSMDTKTANKYLDYYNAEINRNPKIMKKI